MIHYCIEVWGDKEIREHLVWSIFVTFEKWVCQALLSHVNSRYPQDKEERDYAKLWKYTSSGLFSTKTCKGAATQAKHGNH